MRLRGFIDLGALGLVLSTLTLTQSPGSEISLCNLCVLCVSVVYFCSEFINHRDTENTEVAQRRAPFGLLGQSLVLCYKP